MDKDYDIKIRHDFGDEEDFLSEETYVGENREPHRRNGDYRNKKRGRKSEDKKNRKKKKKNGFLRFLRNVFFGVLIIVAFCLIFLKPPEKTVFLIAGTDAGGTRTDTIMLGVYESKKNGGITLLSIPRDTLVSVSDETYASMRKDYPQPGGKGMKINEIYHYAGSNEGMRLLISEIERKFGVEIDYYAKINFDAFEYIIDGIGGIEFEVDKDLDYEDPYQNLKIHLKAGKQVLDGDKAEQLLRFRSGYARADLERVEVQQRFMKAFIAQALSPKNIIKNFGVYKKALDERVETNIRAFNLVKYARCVFTIGSCRMETATMPGGSGVNFGRSGVISDIEKFHEQYGDRYLK